jgi:hypothetical protein
MHKNKNIGHGRNTQNVKPCPICDLKDFLLVYLNDSRVICDNPDCELCGYAFDVDYWNNNQFKIFSDCINNQLEEP